MPINYVNTYSGMEYHVFIRFFARVLAHTSSNATNTEIALQQKIANDYRVYVKKALNDPTSIDASFRRVLIARLNKLYAENFFATQQFAFHLARQIIDDMQCGDALLQSEFLSLAEKSDFITQLEEDVNPPVSIYRNETLTLRAGNFPEKKLTDKNYTPARAQWSELITEGTTHFIAQNWVLTAHYYKQALKLLETSSLYTAADYSKNYADMTCRIAACAFNEGMQNIENKDIEAAVYKLASAYRKILTIHSSRVNAKIKKLRNHYLYTLLNTINTYAIANPGNFKLFNDASEIIPTTDGKLFPQKLELIRNIVKATYLDVKNSLTKDDLQFTLLNLHLAWERNNEALDAHHHPQEVKASRILGQLIVVMLFYTAQKTFPVNRTEAVLKYCEALKASFLIEKFNFDIRKRMIEILIHKLSNEEIEIINRSLEIFSKDNIKLTSGFECQKFLIRLNYQRAFLSSKNNSIQETVELLTQAISYFTIFIGSYAFQDTDQKPLAILAMCLYRSAALLHFKIGEAAINSDLGVTIYHFHKTFEWLVCIPAIQMTADIVEAVSEIKIGLSFAVRDYLKAAMSHDDFIDFFDYIKRMCAAATVPVFKDVYFSALLDTSINRCSYYQNIYNYEQAAKCLNEAEAMWKQLSPDAIQKLPIVITQIHCYQIENLLMLHNSINGYNTIKLHLLIQALNIHNTLDQKFIPEFYKTQIYFIKSLLDSFSFQTAKFINKLLDLEISVVQHQSTIGFFLPSKTEFNQTIKPLIVSLRNNKSIEHVEAVKQAILNYLEKHKNLPAQQLKKAVRLLDNYLLSRRQLLQDSRPPLNEASPTWLPRP